MTKRSTTERGYGYGHQKDREYLIYHHIDGTPCGWCKRPTYLEATNNYDGKPLHADHTKASEKASGGRADRLIHDRCNKQKSNSDEEHGPEWYSHEDANIDWPGGTIIDWTLI